MLNLVEFKNLFLELAKVVGPIIRDVVDFRDYRFTIIIERKIDDKSGILIEKLEFEKKMNALEIDIITKKIKEFIDRERNYGKKF